MNAAQLLQTWGPWVGALLSGLLPFLKYRRDGRKLRLDFEAAEATRAAEAKRLAEAGRADLIKIAHDAASLSIEHMLADIERLRADIARGEQNATQLRGQLEKVQAELADLRKEHIRMVADKDAEIALLKGELRQKDALIECYRRLMEAAGIEPPLSFKQQAWAVGAGDDPQSVEPAI